MISNSARSLGHAGGTTRLFRLPSTRTILDLVGNPGATKIIARAILLIAIILGGYLRLHRLGSDDMSADEGASWAGARATTIEKVAMRERILDPGKLALYDVMLHEWMRVFGENLTTLRRMSSPFGILAIVLSFTAVREILLCLGDRTDPGFADMAGALTAAMVATNLTIVVSDRTARMYPLVLSAELAQITFLVRAQRYRRLRDYAGVTLTTAIGVAANFTVAFLLIAEAAWLGALIVLGWIGRNRTGLAAFVPGLAVVAGLVLLAPFMPPALAAASLGIKRYLDWLHLMPLSWPYEVLRGVSPTHFLFRVFIVLGLFGLAMQFRRSWPAPVFLIVWLAGPFAASMALSYLIHPVESPRYVIVALVGFFALAAVGIASIPSNIVRVIILIFIVKLSIADVHAWLKHPHEAPWGHATAFAEATIPADASIAVFPPYTINVVRYYMPLGQRRRVVPAKNRKCVPAPILLLSGRDITPSDIIANQEACFPHVVKEFPYIEVRTR